MSTVTASPRAARHSASSARPGSTARPWTGTVALVRLFLRRDRVRIVGWVLAIGSTVAATVPALEATYPDAASRQARAAILANPSAVMMTGPGFGLEHYTFGAMVANELSLALFVAVAAVTTQVTARARSASGMAVAVLAVTFVVRGIGDVLDPLGSWLVAGLVGFRRRDVGA